MTEARTKAAEAETAYREEVTAKLADTAREELWRAKMGRSSPMAEAEAVFREEARETVMPVETRFEDLSRMKRGR
jgi:hypothetical protein